MTVDSPTTAPTSRATRFTRPRITRRVATLLVVLVVLVALPLGALAYVAKFGECDMHSKFCSVSIVGTRSEVVVGWLDGLDHLDVFTQTYNGE